MFSADVFSGGKIDGEEVRLRVVSDAGLASQRPHILGAEAGK
jgi:hypothetical protein